MFRLPPIKLWRNISIIEFIIAIVFTFIGMFTISDNLVIHWDGEGIPNNSTGKWILWALLLMAFLSMFTHVSFSKERPGKNALSIEMSGAFSSGLVSTWTTIIVILVIYNFYSLTVIPIIGTMVIILYYILFLIIAYIRNKNVK